MTINDIFVMMKNKIEKRNNMLLEEFDDHKQAVINPSDCVQAIKDMPKVAVSCFSFVTFERLCQELNAQPFAEVKMAHMKADVYKAKYKGKDIALFLSFVGAPSCVGVLEDIFAMGVEKVVLFGTCGVLDENIKDCSIIIPHTALRDEGTSFHYAPPSDEIKVNLQYKEEFINILNEYHCSYTEGKVWTTDGFYRETRQKVEQRKKQGCICVEMECSAVGALAQFREKDIFHFFYAADNLDHEQWDQRSLSNTANLLEKDRIALLAMELAGKMSEDI